MNDMAQAKANPDDKRDQEDCTKAIADLSCLFCCIRANQEEAIQDTHRKVPDYGKVNGEPYSSKIISIIPILFVSRFRHTVAECCGQDHVRLVAILTWSQCARAEVSSTAGMGGVSHLCEVYEH